MIGEEAVIILLQPPDDVSTFGCPVAIEFDRVGLDARPQSEHGTIVFDGKIEGRLTSIIASPSACAAILGTGRSSTYSGSGSSCG
jgi:hypothetical protein